jgi:hypothetical protein
VPPSAGSPEWILHPAEEPAEQASHENKRQTDLLLKVWEEKGSDDHRQRDLLSLVMSDVNKYLNLQASVHSGPRNQIKQTPSEKPAGFCAFRGPKVHALEPPVARGAGRSPSN